MAKPKRSSEDLDAELAAVEAELAALERKKAPAPAEAAQPPAEAEPARGKTRFALPKLPKLPQRGKPEPAPAAPPAPEAPPRAAVATPRFDATLWRQEDGAWVRTVPGDGPVVRRVLDEQGSVVREEPATMRDLEDETPMKAERGIRKLFRRRG